MATVPGALVIGISSPHMKRGLLFKKISENWGRPGAILAAKAPTWVMNPTLPFDGEFIQARFKENENGRAPSSGRSGVATSKATSAFSSYVLA